MCIHIAAPTDRNRQEPVTVTDYVCVRYNLYRIAHPALPGRRSLGRELHCERENVSECGPLKGPQPLSEFPKSLTLESLRV